MIVLGQMHGYRGCIAKERKGLLELSAYIISLSPDANLVWTNNQKSNCCHWERIKCDINSQRVVGLSLGHLMFGNSDPLNLSLFHPFEELQSLNLSFNRFGGLLDNHQGYKSLRKLPKLKILDLSDNGLNNSILPFLRFATSLKTLILGNNMMEGDFPMKGICKWKTLQELDVSGNEFEGQPPQCFASLTKLRVLDLSSNLFDRDLPTFINSLKSLEYLSLLDNNFKGLFSFNSLKFLSKLKVLKLSSISIKQQKEMRGSWLPDFKLRVLELRDCTIEKIPDFLRYQKNMRLIDLSNNNLSGPFPTWILENNPLLEVLYLQYNEFHTLRLPSFVHNLRLLDLSANNFQDTLSDDFGKILSSLRQVDLSDNSFKGSLPTSMGEMKDIHAINFAHNNFSGNLPRSLFMGCHFLKLLQLSHNRFDGQIFPASTNLTWLGTLLVDNNMFTGTIGNGLRNSTMLHVLDMSSNFLTGTIPSWMGEQFLWDILRMSNNLLEGTIPLTLFDSETLELVDLSRNKLSGSIPSHFSNAHDTFTFGMLYLQSNYLTGPLPATLIQNLMILDVRNNELSGSIPQFINASGIGVLLLRGNDLVGPIPRQLCNLRSIRILDVANNKLNGSIPPCISNLLFGAEDSEEELSYVGGIFSYMDNDMGTYYESIIELNQIFPFYLYDLNFSVEFSAKQRYDSYISGTLDYMYGIDLSNNELSGEIPEEVGDLVRARSLNLSHNFLAGSIPESLSKMKDIESLDLSFNKLYGPIPFPLTGLNSLAVFNVSYNNLSGTIPQGKQFNTFGENSYFGNPLLCGPPTNRSCDIINNTKEPDEEGVDDETHMDVVDFYWSLGVTYSTFLVGIFLFMCFDSPWRQGWFRLVDAFLRFFFNAHEH
ncbi:hypothetical protein N665_0748s0026 [Sinapis alba]|nr:hypothetical protein N665_0748s0026 [Sinapis alba]